jgi:hypothetical protein
MAFEKPAPDVSEIVSAWEAWEKSEETTGLPEILQQLTGSGWTANS